MAIDPQVLESSLVRLARLVPDASGLTEPLQQVVAATNRLFACSSGAGLMLVDDEQELHVVAATEPLGDLLQAAQAEVGGGPCVDAFVDRRVVVSGDLAVDDTYPVLGPWLARRGVHAVAGVPVLLAGASVGTLNVMVDRAHDWTGDEIGALGEYGRVVEQVLLAGLVAHRNDVLVRQLQYALDHRVLIERAVGFLMARDAVGAADAFGRLRGAARHDRRKVVDVARDLLLGVPVSQLERGGRRAPGSQPR